MHTYFYIISIVIVPYHMAADQSLWARAWAAARLNAGLPAMHSAVETANEAYSTILVNCMQTQSVHFNVNSSCNI